MIKMPLPAWAFDYNQSYGTSTNVGNCSTYYPSYTSQSMNAYINKANMPAFVRNARAGCCGNGMSFYGYPPSYNTYYAVTHVWAMAVPIQMGWPIGICTLNASIKIPHTPDINAGDEGPAFMVNTCLFIDNDHRLKYGHMYRGTSLPPTAVYDFGVDMTPYMYTPVVQNSDPYCGHMYAFAYNSAAAVYELFVDNTNTKLASINKKLIVDCALNIMNIAEYNEAVPQHMENVIYNGYYYTGPGVYLYNYGNVNKQGNVYMSDWYGWMDAYDYNVLDQLMTFNWRQALPVLNNNYYGAFGYCNQLRHIVVPGTLKSIPNYFINGNNLNSVTFQEGVNCISSYAVDTFYSAGCTVTIPKSVHMVGSYAVRGSSINVPMFTHNAPIFNNMFNNYSSDYKYNFYEQPTQFTVNDLPLKQLRPDLYLYRNDINIYGYPAAFCTPENIANDTYNSTTRINFQGNQAAISQDGDTYDITWHNANTGLIFDDPNVCIGAHTNEFIAQPFNMTNEGFDVQIRSLEFPNLINETHATFINTPFIINGNINNNIRCSIIGCTLHGVDGIDVPDIVDGAYITEQVWMQQPYPSGAADPDYLFGAPSVPNINIKVPWHATGIHGEYLGGVETIYLSEPAYRDYEPFCNINIHDGYAARLFTGTGHPWNYWSNRAVVVSNVERVHVNDMVTAAFVQYNNCYNVVGLPYYKQQYPTNTYQYNAPIDINTLCHNYIIVGGAEYNAVDFSAVDNMHIRYARVRTTGNLLSNAFGSDVLTALTHPGNGRMADVVLGWSNNYAYPHCNSAEKGRLLMLANLSTYAYMAGNPAVSYDNTFSVNAYLPTVFNNCTLPSSVTVCNIEAGGSSNASMYFINCRGAAFHLEGYATMFGNLIMNHKSTIDLYINSTIIPFVNSNMRQVAVNCNINLLYLQTNKPSLAAMNKPYSISATHESNYNMVAHTITAMAVGIHNSNIDMICVNDTNTTLQLTRCIVNHFENPTGVIRGLELVGGVYRAPMSHILNNVAGCMRILGGVFFDDDLSIYIPENMRTSSYDIYSGRINVGGIQGRNVYIHHGQYPYAPTEYYEPAYGSYVYDDTTALAIGTAAFSLNDIEKELWPMHHNNYFVACKWHLPRCRSLSINYNLSGYTSSSLNTIRDCVQANGGISITGLENCLALTLDMQKCEFDVTLHVHPNCSIALKHDSIGSVTILNDANGNKYPVDLNVQYKDSTTSRTLGDGYCNLYDYLDSVNIVFNDGSEEPTDDYCLLPNVAMIPTGSLISNAYHVLLANGVHKRIKAPYTKVTNYNSVAIRNVNANAYPSVAISGQMFIVTHPDNRCAYISCSTYGIGYYPNQVWDVKSLEPLDTITFTGTYNSWTGFQNGSYGASTIIALNGSTNNIRTYGGSYGIRTNLTYLRDDGASFNATNRGNTCYNDCSIGIIDLSAARRSRYALGFNAIYNCKVEMLLLTVGSYCNIIANNAVNNCPRLYWVDMNLINASNFRINDNAFINCPLLSELYVPRNTNYIGNGAFNRTGLKHIVVPSTCTFGTNAVPADCQISYY